MSSIIQRLPDNIANQIAAGEVIQRPASVIKELMENAIDAGAERIVVNIKDSGKTLIQVIDNGSGMNAGDAELCFERHATSKIRSASDLFNLHTKGFRGEALASIAAIAHVVLKTRLDAHETGTQISIEGSKVLEISETMCPKGSSFEIKNLFYNVPARRNFLKSDQVEFGHIQDEFERVAFAHPSISFSLVHNETVVYELPDAILRKRIVDILGKNFIDRLVPIEESTEIVKLKGFVLKPEFSRKTRGEQFFFVNDRFFKSTYFNHAISKAFEGLLKDKTFPSYFLYLDIDPAKIDVNIHPTKTEIKFEEEKFIYSILLSSVRQSLGKYNISPTLDFERETSFDVPVEIRRQPVIEPQIRVNTAYNPFQSNSSGKKNENYSEAIKNQGFGTSEALQKDWENFYEITEVPLTDSSRPSEIEELFTERSETLLKNGYVLVTNKSGIMFIHARRALERVIYDNIFKSFVSNPLSTQKLLFSLEIEFSRSEAEQWLRNAKLFQQLGFNGDLEEGILVVDGIPAVLEIETVESTIHNLISTVVERDIETSDIAAIVIQAIASAASRKKTDLRSHEARAQLIEELFQCENHLFTESGQRIIDVLRTEDIDKKFTR